MSNSESWEKIFRDNNILNHNFRDSPFIISAEQIKRSCQDYNKTSEKEVRLLCKQDSRESRPTIFVQNNLFILPIENGVYSIIQGEGYVDIPPIENKVEIYQSKLSFIPDTSQIGDSEMQHIDYAYATSLIRTFMEDPTLVLTIRGRRKYTPKYSFQINKHKISITNLQAKVEAGYEGEKAVVLFMAKPTKYPNVSIRQLFYPYKQWQSVTKKKVTAVLFQKNWLDKSYLLWNFEFHDAEIFNSFSLKRMGKYRISS